MSDEYDYIDGLFGSTFQVDTIALREAAEKATPGRWFASGITKRDGDEGHWLFIQVDEIGEIARIYQAKDTRHIDKQFAPAICDQRFIALANPANIIAMCKELDEYRLAEKENT